MVQNYEVRCRKSLCSVTSLFTHSKPCATEDPMCRGADARNVESQNFPVGEVGKLGEEVPAQVLSLPFDPGTKLRVPSPTVFVLLDNAS
ncbi:hypothetical protein TNCV_534461 [Trichonephila clavipes]|nr:hypothetical protein TNCV_534461 [Trichonephila clavipes]